jgi:hypothetical protein
MRIGSHRLASISDTVAGGRFMSTGIGAPSARLHFFPWSSMQSGRVHTKHQQPEQ